MNATTLYKMASFMGRLQEATAPDRPERTRAGRALALGGLGAGLGTAGGYLHAANQFASSPFEHMNIMKAVGERPGVISKLLQEAAGGPAFEGMALHRELFPAIAKAVPKKLALPALALGGLGGLAGLMSKVHKTTPQERFQKLRG